MKKFSVLMAFVFAVMISSTAWAANWTQIVTQDGAAVYVVRDSIQREIHSSLCNFDRTDGFSAKIKLEFSGSSFKMINLIGFYEENGVKKMVYLEKLDENGNVLIDSDNRAEEQNADGTNGTIWPKVFDWLKGDLQ